jgi:hypothetical protein
MATAEGEQYLGLIFDSGATANIMASHGATCYSPPIMQSPHKCVQLWIFHVLFLHLEMLHTVMEPSGFYGSELWGLLSIPSLGSEHWSVKTFYGIADVVEVKRCALIRKWLKVPSSAPSLPLLHELGCGTLIHAYLCRAVRLYNALLSLEDSCA